MTDTPAVKPRSACPRPKRAARRKTAPAVVTSGPVTQFLGRTQIPRELKMTPAKALAYMSPFGKEAPPINPNSLGHFTTVNLLTRANLTTSTSQALVLVFAPSIRGVYQASVWNASTGVRDPNFSSAAAPTYRFQSADTPIAYRPLRAGLRIRNTTDRQSQGGSVRVLQQSSPIEFAWASVATPPLNVDLTAAMAAELSSATASNPRSVEYTGVDLGQGQNEAVLGPATMSDYNSYGGAFASASGNTEFQTAFDSLVNDMAMNALVVVFEPTSTPQTYSMTLDIQAALRYPSNTLLGDMAKAPPPTKHSHVEFINGVHDHVGKHQGLKPSFEHFFDQSLKAQGFAR